MKRQKLKIQTTLKQLLTNRQGIRRLHLFNQSTHKGRIIKQEDETPIQGVGLEIARRKARRRAFSPGIPGKD